jgi:hypothetical protein
MTKPDFSEVWESLVSGKWTLSFADYIGTLIDAKQDLGTCDRLQQIFDQCPDWDGHGANPVNAESFLRVRDFVMKLPDDVEKPEVVPEPDGDVVMAWTKDGRHVCIVGIEPTGKLIIAVPRDRIPWLSSPTKHVHLAENHPHWPISTKYELYAFLQAAYRE